MLGCLISLIIAVIVALIVLYVLESVMAPFMALPPPIITLLRLLIGLLVLLYFLSCIGFLGSGFPEVNWRH
jgi:hypothetical protein